MVNRKSFDLRRWRSKASKASRLCEHRSDIAQSTCSDITTVTDGYTTILPELYSVPPMPSFQKPRPGEALSTSNAVGMGSLPRPDTVPNRMDALGLHDNSPPVQTNTKLNAQTPGKKRTTFGRNVSSLLLSPKARARNRFAPFPPQDHHERPIPSLPSNWTKQHDKAICILDVKNYTHSAMVAKLRRTFPSLDGTLTPIMIDKRLQQLDQNVELDYYKAGLEKHSQATRAKLPLPPLPLSPQPLAQSWMRDGQDGGACNASTTRDSDETIRLAEIGSPVLKVRLTS
jgi:hypothetical protein